MANITSAIRAKGMTVGQFCEKVLNTDYKAFRWRVREQKLRLSEIRQIIVFTNMTFEQLFMDEELPQTEQEQREEVKPVQRIVEEKPKDIDEDFIDTFN